MVNEPKQPGSETIVWPPVLIIISLYNVLEYKIYKLSIKNIPSPRIFMYKPKKSVLRSYSRNIAYNKYNNTRILVHNRSNLTMHSLC